MTKKKSKKKLIAAILATTTGFSGLMIGSSIIAYDACFPKFVRPDYAIYAGNYSYEYYKDTLYRDEFYFPSDKNDLCAYFYPTSSETEKGMVVFAHGFKSGADDYLPIIEYLVNNSYSVFTYNATGVYESGGDSQIGMCQSLVDLDYALKFIKNSALYSDKRLFLLGHSWGGYACASVLALQDKISACALIAPMYNGATIMLEKGAEYVGPLASMPKPIFSAYQNILFGSYSKLNAVKGINSTNIPVFIAHGVDDTTIRYQTQSVIAHKDEITNENVTYYTTKGIFGGHDSIWHSLEANLYRLEVESELKLLSMQNKKLSYEKKVEFYKTIDNRLYSEVNEDLMNKILSVFENA